MDDVKVQLNIVTPRKPAVCRTASPDMFHTTHKKENNFSCAKKDFLRVAHTPSND